MLHRQADDTAREDAGPTSYIGDIVWTDGEERYR